MNELRIHSIPINQEKDFTINDIKLYIKIRIFLLLIQILFTFLFTIALFDLASEVRNTAKSIEHHTYHTFADYCCQFH